MFKQTANYTALSLSGTMTEAELGDGITGTSVHRIYCLSAGNVTIQPKGGGNFTWTASANEFIDVVVKTLTVNAGTFIGFKTKFQPHQTGLFG